MNKKTIPESDLILNEDGSVYHLHLLPGELADTVITVGDPNRVPEVSKHFDSIEIKKTNRECVTHTGYIGKKRISVASTGMGVGSIDIVLNELDAVVNVDFETRTVKDQLTKLDIIRVGTAGTLQEDVPLDSFVVSEYALGLDTLMHFYKHENSQDEINFISGLAKHIPELIELMHPYVTKGCEELNKKFHTFAHPGITFTCSGFYAPQDRHVRMQPTIHNFIEKVRHFSYQGLRPTNMEMETSAIYGLSKVMGHRYCSLSAIVANRITQKFTTKGKESVEKLIELTLEKVSS